MPRFFGSANSAHNRAIGLSSGFSNPSSMQIASNSPSMISGGPQLGRRWRSTSSSLATSCSARWRSCSNTSKACGADLDRLRRVGGGRARAAFLAIAGFADRLVLALALLLILLGAARRIDLGLLALGDVVAIEPDRIAVLLPGT